MAVNSTYFKVLNNNHDGSRAGVLKTRRGDVLTPTFMPDGTRGVVKSLTAEQVSGAGIDIVLANTYHLHLQPGENTVKKLGGLHKFGKWQGPILTDSGGFQVFSLGKHTKVTEEGVSFKDPVTGEKRLITPETSMQIQFALGSDIFVAFDHLIGLDNTSDKEVKEAFERTHRWLERCITEFKSLTSSLKPSERPLLFGVVQGGLDLELRAKSLEIVQNSDVDGIAIGGLSVGEPRAEMYKVLKHLAPLYRGDKPRFLLGVGDPADLKVAFENGIDMADCVLPTRNARHATIWIRSGCTVSSCQASEAPAPTKLVAHRGVETSGAPSTYHPYVSVRSSASPSAASTCTRCGEPYDKKIHLTNAQYAEDSESIDKLCDCYTCKNGYSKGFLRHQFKVGEPLAGSLCSIHNLRYLQRIAESYRI